MWKNQRCGMRYRSVRRRWTSEKSRGIIGEGRNCEKRAIERPSQYIAQQPSAAQAAQPNPVQPAQPSPPSRHRAGRKCCNLRCGRTRRRQLAPRSCALVIRGFSPEPLQNARKNIVFSCIQGRSPWPCRGRAPRARSRRKTMPHVGDLTRRRQRGGLHG